MRKVYDSLRFSFISTSKISLSLPSDTKDLMYDRVTLQFDLDMFSSPELAAGPRSLNRSCIGWDAVCATLGCVRDGHRIAVTVTTRATIAAAATGTGTATVCRHQGS